MNIEEQFNLIASEYDGNRKRFIPCFNDYYINATKLILSNIKKPGKVLDLGAGTGLLTSCWYKESPDTEYMLIDIADEMLAVSRRRFEGIPSITHEVMDYTIELPKISFDCVISALSIHHLDDVQKQSLFDRVFTQLPKGGIFVNYDQFCAETEATEQWFNAYWESQLLSSDLTERDLQLWKERRKLDKECSVDQQKRMLQASGFSDVACIYSYHKFSVVIAVK